MRRVFKWPPRLKRPYECELASAGFSSVASEPRLNCKGNYGNPPLFYSLMVNPGSRESGYRFARDFIISPREEGREGGRERGISCYFVVGWFLINFSIFRSIDINCCLYFEERRIYGLLENFK